MLLRVFLGAILLVATTVVSAQDLNSDKGKLSYAIGWDLGADIKSRSTEMDVEAVIAAIRDAVGGRDPKVPTEEMIAKLQEFNQKIQQERLEAFKKLAEENQQKSDQFLAEQRGKNGIVSLPSGVLYRVIENGDGGRPKLEDQVTVHYRGSKMDGREFDSSFARGVPMKLKVNQVLKGWQEVLPLMKTGATWQLFVPPELAFGAQGQMPAVGPNEALKFDLKLVDIGEE